MLNISGIHEGFVLDHIQAGMSLQIYHDLKLDQLELPGCDHQKMPRAAKWEKKTS